MTVEHCPVQRRPRPAVTPVQQALVVRLDRVRVRVRGGVAAQDGEDGGGARARGRVQRALLRPVRRSERRACVEERLRRLCRRGVVERQLRKFVGRGDLCPSCDERGDAVKVARSGSKRKRRQRQRRVRLGRIAARAVPQQRGDDGCRAGGARGRDEAKAVRRRSRRNLGAPCEAIGGVAAALPARPSVKGDVCVLEKAGDGLCALCAPRREQTVDDVRERRARAGVVERHQKPRCVGVLGGIDSVVVLAAEAAAVEPRRYSPRHAESD
mmetsp:Transcript_10679/g.35449  ORF Transcript_10679/g.35449 Transcript_10679/m.35449 type:complete len:269 (-) Transcript_10679:1771-2577(-)